MIAVLAFVVAFAVRLIWILEVQSPHAAVYSDMAGYLARADEVLGLAPVTDPRIHAFYPFGTHYLVAGELALCGRDSTFGIAIVHALVGAIPPTVVALLGRRLCPSRAIVLLASMLAAVWQPQVVYAAFFMSELWFSAAVALASLFFVRAFEAPRDRWGSIVLAGTFAAVSFVIRPQVVLTFALVALLGAIGIVRSRGARGSRPLRRRLARRAAAVLVPIAIVMGLSSLRLHRLSGRFGLVSENGPLMRLFGETDVGRVEATWTTPDGGRYFAWYAAGLKKPYTDENTFRFEGYVGDPDILDDERRARLAVTPSGARVARAWKNLTSLVWRSFPFPEADFHASKPRLQLSRVFRKILYALLALAPVGLFAMARRGPAAAAVYANLATVVALPMLFYAEARYRVPYDPFVILAAAVGAFAITTNLRDRLRARRARRNVSGTLRRLSYEAGE